MSRSLSQIFLALLLAAPLAAATWTEDFSSNPVANGWQIFGDTNLFTWNPTHQNLAVTWDSSRSNSYFWRPFGTILAKQDDFSFAFDLRLTDLATGVTPGKTNAFEFTIGLLNFNNATNSNLWRGTGVNSAHGARNTCEFDYFPDAGFGDTISPTLIASNNQFSTQFAFPLALDPGALFHIAMSYTAANRTLTTTMTRNGAAFGPIPDVIFSATRDFRFDRFAVISWSDAGTTDSLLAHGVVDNIIITTPPPAVQNLSIARTNNLWQAQLTSRTNFFYTLERTADLQTWANISPTVSGTGTTLLLQDTNAPSAKYFYRVRAERP